MANANKKATMKLAFHSSLEPINFAEHIGHLKHKLNN